MPGHQHLAAVILAGISAVVCGEAADAQQIVSRAQAALRSDWAAAPEYSFIQRDEFRRNDKPASRTHQVLMIDGSDYYMLVAIDDRPLSLEQQQTELRRLREEVQRRGSEDPASRERRIRNYRRQRDQNGELTAEFASSFHFELTGEEEIDGRTAYALSATPRKKKDGLSRAAKILAGMRGHMWVDKETMHVIRAEATVITPVSIFGIFARVLPGTSMELEMKPVTDSVWLASLFSLNLEISKLWFHSTQTTRSSYSGYRLNGPRLAELLSDQH